MLAAVFIFGFRKINVTKNNPLFFRIKNNKSDIGIFLYSIIKVIAIKAY